MYPNRKWRRHQGQSGHELQSSSSEEEMAVDDDQVTQPRIVHCVEESEVALNLPSPVLSNPSSPVVGP